MALLYGCSLIIMLCFNTMVGGAPYHRKRCPITDDQLNIQNVKELQCEFGVTVDDCGQKHCMKGPGEFCGGLNSIYGLCAPGLVCSDCNRCRGCSLRTLKCFEDKCLKILYRYYGKLG